AVKHVGRAIWEGQHSRASPAGNEAVVITTRAFDPDGPISVTLRYRLDAGQTTNINPALFSSINMVDDGTGADAVARDGIYTASIPGHAAGAIVACYIQTVDPLNNTSVFPQDVFSRPGFDRCFPNDAMSRECVLRRGDT